MSRQPLVSIIVPTCNRWDVLHRCLDALVRQTHPSFEIIVIDDASTDGTPEHLERFAEAHPDLALTLLRNEVQRGANGSRSRGIDAATGTLIALTDSDCIAEPDWLEKLVSGFASDHVGAVTGLVTDPPPRNIYELAFRGSHRVTNGNSASRRVSPARRLVGGNMCVRRELLTRFQLDEDPDGHALNPDGSPHVSGTGLGFEESLYLRLRAADFDVRAVADAVVLHEHYYSRRSFFKQGYGGGASAARLVYRYHLPPRLDLLPLVLAYVSLPFIVLDTRVVWVAAMFFASALAAIVFNELAYKGKTIGQTLLCFPVQVVYYHTRLIGYVVQSVRLRLGWDRMPRTKLVHGHR